MKHGYKNPLVTYEEIVEAIKAIIDCSLSNNYMDDFDYLNLKYESESSENYEGAEERALYKAVKALEKTIESANKIIRDNLEQNLKELELSRFTIHVDYLLGQERRKLAASQTLIEKLTNASINLNTIFNASDEEEKADAIDPIKPPKIEKIEDKFFKDDEDENDEETDFSVDKDTDTNKEYSDFEKKVLINFPEFFKEELEIAKKYSEDETLDVDDLFNTMELEPITMDYVAAEKLEDEDDDSDIILADDIVDSKNDEYNLDFVMPNLDKKSESINEQKEEDDVQPEEDFSLPLDELMHTKEKVKEEKVEVEQPEKKKINKEKVILLKKALEKAKSMQDDKLIEAVKKQLAKELGVEK